VSDQGKAYTAFIEAELKAERDRRVHFDSRGALLVTTSASLVSLLAAVVAFFRVGTTYTFPRDALPALVVALGAFSMAAAAGILAGWNRPYSVADVPTLNKLLDERWDRDDEVRARNNVGYMQVRTVNSLRRANSWKGRWILCGLVAQLVALLALGLVVYLMLYHSTGA
jgi:hypothetical protein